MTILAVPDDSLAVSIVFVGITAWAAWGLARPLAPSSVGEARLAAAHRIVSGLATVAALGFLAWDAHLQGGLRWDADSHRESVFLGMAAIAHGVCRALAGTAWFGPGRDGMIRPCVELLAWFLIAVALVVLAMGL